MGNADWPWVLLDHVLNLVLLTPLCVMYWWSTWTLLDHYIYPDPKDFDKTGHVSAVIGLVGVWVIYTFQPIWQLYREPARKSLLAWLWSSHLFIYLYGFFTVNHWRGVWYMLDYYTGVTWESNVVCMALSTAVLLLLRSYHCPQAPPTIAGIDLDPDIFEISTRYARKWDKSKFWFICDASFTALFIHSMVVVYWRGTWELLAFIIYPEDGAKQSWVTLILGYTMAVTTYICQFPADISARQLKKFKYSFIFTLIIDAGLLIIGNAATVASWKGFWDGYILVPWPRDYLTGLWIGHTTATLGLWCLSAGVVVLPKGVNLDGGSPERPGLLLYMEYTQALRDWYRSRYRQVVSTYDDTKMEKKELHIVLNGAPDGAEKTC